MRGVYWPSFSSAYMLADIPSCRMLLRQAMRLAASLARPKLGNSMAARMAMIAMTTSNSTSVNARATR